MRNPTDDGLGIKNVKEAHSWFEVLQTGQRSQTAMMKLKPGQASDDKMEAHAKSEQVLTVLQGEVLAEIGAKSETLKKGDAIVIPAGTRHKFTNRSNGIVVTFNVYSPPEYPGGIRIVPSKRKNKSARPVRRTHPLMRLAQTVIRRQQEKQ